MTDKSKKIHSVDAIKLENDALWAFAVRDVEPLDKHNLSATEHKEPVEIIYNTPPLIEQHNIIQKELAHQTYDIDKSTAQKLKTGKFRIEARLDLHGLNQADAYNALAQFIPNSYHANFRCVLIITGKGGQKSSDPLKTNEKGVLHRRTPEWLSEPYLAKYILKTATAQPKDGGSGAMYVLIRRKRHN